MSLRADRRPCFSKQKTPEPGLPSARLDRQADRAGRERGTPLRVVGYPEGEEPTQVRSSPALTDRHGGICRGVGLRGFKRVVADPAVDLLDAVVLVQFRHRPREISRRLDLARRRGRQDRNQTQTNQPTPATHERHPLVPPFVSGASPARQIKPTGNAQTIPLRSGAGLGSGSALPVSGAAPCLLRPTWTPQDWDDAWAPTLSEETVPPLGEPKRKTSLDLGGRLRHNLGRPRGEMNPANRTQGKMRGDAA